jgi:thiol-disulfide isomerase/thioredoxin
MHRAIVTAVVVAQLLGAVGVEAGELKPFVEGSYASLLAARDNEPFLLVLWSTTCVPCRDEFRLIARVRNSEGNFPLVLISTDIVEDTAIAEKLLARYDMGDFESWIFAQDNHARLRYEIDPSWYGEMPRSYFCDADHVCTGISGSLEYAQLLTWVREL